LLHRRSQFWMGELTSIPVPTFIQMLESHRSFRLYAFVCLLANDRTLNCTVPLSNSLINQTRVKLDYKTFELAVNHLLDRTFLRRAEPISYRVRPASSATRQREVLHEYELLHPSTGRWLGREWRYSPACRQLYRKEMSPVTRTMEKVPTGEYEFTGASPDHNLYEGLRDCSPREAHIPVPKHFLHQLAQHESTTIRLYMSCIQMGRVINNQTDYMVRTKQLRDLSCLSAPTFRSALLRLPEHRLANVTKDGSNCHVVLLNLKTGTPIGFREEKDRIAVKCVLSKEQVAEVLRRLVGIEPHDLGDDRNFLVMMPCPTCNTSRPSGLKIGYKAGSRGSWWCDICQAGGGLERLAQRQFGFMAQAAFNNLD
jgi:hypothetical protein